MAKCSTSGAVQQTSALPSTSSSDSISTGAADCTADSSNDSSQTQSRVQPKQLFGSQDSAASTQDTVGKGQSSMVHHPTPRQMRCSRRQQLQQHTTALSAKNACAAYTEAPYVCKGMLVTKTYQRHRKDGNAVPSQPDVDMHNKTAADQNSLLAKPQPCSKTRPAAATAAAIHVSPSKVTKLTHSEHVSSSPSHNTAAAATPVSNQQRTLGVEPPARQRVLRSIKRMLGFGAGGVPLKAQ